MMSRFVMSIFEASDAKSIEGLQISYHGSIIWQASFRVAITKIRMPRLNYFVAGTILFKHLFKNH